MKVLQIMLVVEDAELEERIINLEKRCKKIDISLQQIFQIIVPTIPTKPFVDVLLSLSDVKIMDIEREKKYEKIWSLFGISNKEK